VTSANYTPDRDVWASKLVDRADSYAFGCMEALYRIWSEAGRPAAVKVSDRIQELDLKGSASKETVRRTLRQGRCPRVGERRDRLRRLSQMAGRDPERLVIVESEGEYGDIEFGPESARAVFH
ncbi:hypothetical protein, partial [Streptomonospora halophila]|uniref:hypothetical protein n=1 Tax=Streptomonospora halophila TaxID=427369 RepID=UPI0031E85809